MTAQEAADVLRVHRRTILNYIRRGLLVGVQFGGKWLLSRKLVESKLAEAGAL